MGGGMAGYSDGGWYIHGLTNYDATHFLNLLATKNLSIGYNTTFSRGYTSSNMFKWRIDGTKLIVVPNQKSSEYFSTPVSCLCRDSSTYWIWMGMHAETIGDNIPLELVNCTTIGDGNDIELPITKIGENLAIAQAVDLLPNPDILPTAWYSWFKSRTSSNGWLFRVDVS